MLCVAADSVEIVKTAIPLEFSFTGEYSAVVPSRNVTVPVGTGGGLPTVPAIVAVKVTGEPLIPGLTDDASAIVGVVCAKAGMTKPKRNAAAARHRIEFWFQLLPGREQLRMNSLVFLVSALEICN
jgi:hypothetical protein